MQRGRAGLSLLLLLAGAARAQDAVVPERVEPAPGVTVETSYSPWILTAVTPPEIDAETAAHGPCGKPACTEWNIDPVLGFEPMEGGCGPSEISTRVTVIYRLPRWLPATPPTARMQAWWPGQLAHILVHEGGHRDLAVTTANAIQEMLEALPPERSCEEMQALAKSEALALIAEGNRLQRDYDAREEAALRAAMKSR
jgi:predicted secreted Zn-dependent protease